METAIGTSREPVWARLEEPSSVDGVLEDIDRDRFMSPQEAVDYGLVDGILEPRKVRAG
jgi:ATP-dependent protease ClpP protease subunit